MVLFLFCYDSDGEAPPACVHALNILRALYRDSRLGEHIVPFISDGVMIAIEGFSAKFWPVRCLCTVFVMLYHVKFACVYLRACVCACAYMCTGVCVCMCKHYVYTWCVHG